MQELSNCWEDKTVNRLTRRSFLAASAAVAATARSFRQIEAADVPPAPPTVELGKTGIRCSRLAFGTGTHGGRRQSDQSRLGFEKLVRLFIHAYERGITLFDMADLYGTHVYCREALRSIPRDKVTLLTKLWWRYDGPVRGRAESYRGRVAQATVERFLHELNTDRLDICLLHCVTTATWDQELVPYMETFERLKEQGKIRAVGVSCHDFGAMETAARSPWVDVILARINPHGVKMDGTPEDVLRVLRIAKANGKVVIGMKIFGEGALIDRREQCMRFAQSIGVLDAMTIGFDDPAEIDDTLRLMAKYPHTARG